MTRRTIVKASIDIPHTTRCTKSLRRIPILATLLGAVLLAASPPAWVHHSGAMFDRTKVVKIIGVVTEFNWSNPHSSFKVDVSDANGNIETWAIEMNGPNNLVHEGWKRTSIKPGDKVSVIVNPLRDGRPGGWWVGIMLADGKFLGSDHANPEDNGPSSPSGGATPGAAVGDRG
jgi:hypothetical protein